MDKEDKDKIILGVYYDSETGFGRIAETYKESKRKLNSITYNDVKEFLERQSIRQVKAYRGFNSYVATEPLQEIQIDKQILPHLGQLMIIIGIVLSQPTFSQNTVMLSQLRTSNQPNQSEQ